MTASAWQRALAATALAAALAATAPAVAQQQPAAPAPGQPAMPEVTWPPPPDKPAPKVEIIKVQDWRSRARDMVETLSEYVRARAPSATLLMRGGASLLFRTEKDQELADLAAPPGVVANRPEPEPIGTLQRQFARAIDGVVVDGLSCGFTPELSADQVKRLHGFGVKVLAIEACPTDEAAKAARESAAKLGVLAHVGGPDSLGQIPGGRLAGANPQMVQAIGEAKTILFNLDNRAYASKGDWLRALGETNHDVLVIEPFFRGDKALTPQEVYALKFKKVGTPRLVLARLPMTTAYDTAWYWKATWKVGNPCFIKDVGERPGAFVVDYTNPDWRSLVGQTFSGLMDLGFDGIMLDGMDAVARMDDEAVN